MELHLFEKIEEQMLLVDGLQHLIFCSCSRWQWRISVALILQTLRLIILGGKRIWLFTLLQVLLRCACTQTHDVLSTCITGLMLNEMH